MGGVLLGRFGISGVFWGCAVMAFAWALLVFRPRWPRPRSFPAEAGRFARLRGDPRLP